MYTVYVLRNPQGRLYIGQTEDISRRLAEHAAGTTRWSKSRGPWELVLSEECSTRAEALRRERALKTGRLNQQLRRSVISAERVLPGKD